MAFKTVNGKLVKSTKSTKAVRAAEQMFDLYLQNGLIQDLGNGKFTLTNPTNRATVLDDMEFSGNAILEFAKGYQSSMH